MNNFEAMMKIDPEKISHLGPKVSNTLPDTIPPAMKHSLFLAIDAGCRGVRILTKHCEKLHTTNPCNRGFAIIGQVMSFVIIGKDAKGIDKSKRRKGKPERACYHLILA